MPGLWKYISFLPTPRENRLACIDAAATGYGSSNRLRLPWHMGTGRGASSMSEILDTSPARTRESLAVSAARIQRQGPFRTTTKIVMVERFLVMPHITPTETRVAHSWILAKEELTKATHRCCPCVRPMSPESSR